MGSVSLETINENLVALQKDMEFIKNIIVEDFELTDEVKKELEAARKTSEEEHVSQKEMEREFLG